MKILSSKSYNDLVKQISNAESSARDERSKRIRCENNFASSQREVQELRNKYSKVCEELKTLLQKNPDELNQKIASKESELREEKKNNMSLKKKLDEISKKNLKLEKTTDQLKSKTDLEIKKLKDELQSSNGRIGGFKKENNKLQSELKIALEKIENFKKDAKENHKSLTVKQYDLRLKPSKSKKR